MEKTSSESNRCPCNDLENKSYPQFKFKADILLMQERK